MTSFPGVYRSVSVLVLTTSLYIPAAAGAETPPAYSLEQRYFNGRPADPNPIAKIYVSGDWHRTEVYVDGKLRSITISRPDRNVVYLISESDRTYVERPFEELRAQGWSPGFSLAEYQEKARKGRLALTSLGSETVNGQACEKYAIAYGKGPSQHVSSHFWVSASTGLPVQWKSVLVGDSTSRIEWSNLTVAPPPAELFELPRSYRKVRGAQD